MCLVVRDVGWTVPAFEGGVREHGALPGEELICPDLRGVVRRLRGDDGQRRATAGWQRGGGPDGRAPLCDPLGSAGSLPTRYQLHFVFLPFYPFWFLILRGDHDGALKVQNKGTGRLEKTRKWEVTKISK